MSIVGFRKGRTNRDDGFGRCTIRLPVRRGLVQSVANDHDRSVIPNDGID